MKKLNFVCGAIAVLFSVGAQAGTAIATPLSTAIENFGATTTAATLTTGAPITYSLSTITAVNGGSTVYFTVRLTGGLFVGTPAVNNFTFGGVVCGAINPLICVVTPSADRTTVKVAVTPQSTATLGLGAFSYTPADGAFNAVNTTLAAVGGKVSASIGLTTVDPVSIQATAPQTNVDGALGVADLAVGARAVTPVAGAPTSTVRIDLTATPPASAYTSLLAPLARVRFIEVAGVNRISALGANAGDYLVSGTSLATTLTLASGTFPIGSKVGYYTSAACGGVAAGEVTITSGNAAGPITITAAAPAPVGQPVTNPVTATGMNQIEAFVCMTAPSAGNTANPIQPAISAILTPTIATEGVGTAAGTGYNLQFNGSSVDVLTYWPGALDAFSYKGYLRITNTGSVSANVSFAHVNKDNGAIFNAAVIMANLAPGESRLISSVAIDAVAGAAPSNLESGRARITAPTNGLRVQSLLQTGNDAPIEYRANNGL